MTTHTYPRRAKRTPLFVRHLREVLEFMLVVFGLAVFASIATLIWAVMS